MPDSGLPLLFVVGTTASGKTELGIRLAEALGGEVISADSVQVYRYFDIGSAKPNPSELGRARHHLIDIAEPDDPIEASRFAELAWQTIDAVRNRGVIPIIVGGTFLWIRTLIFGLAEAPKGDQELRRQHQAWAEKQGRAALHRRLVEVDPELAQRLHPNDLVRVSRALEVFELSGQRLSDLQKQHGLQTPKCRPLLLSVKWEEAEYERRLALRVMKMLETGLTDEVSSLLERGYGTTRAMAAVGYKETRAALLQGPIDREKLGQEIIRSTRVFARRQRTWIRDEAITWTRAESLMEPQLPGDLLTLVKAHLG